MTSNTPARYWLLFICHIAGYLLSTPTLAFQVVDTDPSLLSPIFRRENFLDITGYQYRKQQDISWQQSQSGFRSSGGSLGQDFLYTIVEYKYRKQLNPVSEFRLHGEQESFFHTPDLKNEVEMGFRPFSFINNGNHVYFSILGTPTYGKRDSDFGVAFELGERPQRYVRFAYIRHDLFFNQKNPIDKDFYQVLPKERRLETAWTGESFSFYLDLKTTNKHSKVFASNENQVYQQQGSYAKLELDYQIHPQDLLGVTLRSFQSDKELIEANTTDSSGLDIKYTHGQLYWLTDISSLNIFDSPTDLTLTLRHDEIHFDSDVVSEGYFDTTQFYMSIHHQCVFNSVACVNLDYSLHLGEAQLTEYQNITDQFLMNTTGRETKLRLSFELMSKDQSSSLMFSTNWNLDNLDENHWDGGHIAFQSVF